MRHHAIGQDAVRIESTKAIGGSNIYLTITGLHCSIGLSLFTHQTVLTCKLLDAFTWNIFQNAMICGKPQCSIVFNDTHHTLASTIQTYIFEVIMF